VRGSIVFVVEGKRFKVDGVDASFVVSTGWTASYGEHDGQSGIAIRSKKFPGVMFVVTVVAR